jgi:hypothetical protein
MGVEPGRGEEEGWRIWERRGELFLELPQSTCVKLSSKGSLYISGGMMHITTC